MRMRMSRVWIVVVPAQGSCHCEYPNAKCRSTMAELALSPLSPPKLPGPSAACAMPGWIPATSAPLHAGQGWFSPRPCGAVQGAAEHFRDGGKRFPAAGGKHLDPIPAPRAAGQAGPLLLHGVTGAALLQRDTAGPCPGLGVPGALPSRTSSTASPSHWKPSAQHLHPGGNPSTAP